MKRILNFGSLNIDMVYAMPHIVRPGETLSSDELSLFPGGKGLNQSVALSRAGASVYHAGKIGADGDILKNVLVENSINCDYLSADDEKSGHAIIQVEQKGQNCIILYGGANQKIERAMIDNVLENFDSNDLLVCQNEINNMDYLINSAYERKIPIILNPSPIDKDILKCDLKKLDTIIINEIEGADFTGETEPQKICDKLISIAPNLKIVLTIGKDGVLYKDAGGFETHGIFNVKVVDTTAAGDTFLGFFTAVRFAGATVSYALRAASAASSIAVSRRGATPSIPTMAEVEKFLLENKPIS